MKKQMIIWVLSVFSTLSSQGQNISELMQGFDNMFALAHTELYTKEENKTKRSEDDDSSLIVGLFLPYHISIRLVEVEANWLQQITTLVKNTPSVVHTRIVAKQ